MTGFSKYGFLLIILNLIVCQSSSKFKDKTNKVSHFSGSSTRSFNTFDVKSAYRSTTDRNQPTPVINNGIVKYNNLALQNPQSGASTIDYINDHPGNKNDTSENQGVSLVFVFDATASMQDDLNGAREAAKMIIDAMLKRPDKPIRDYVLVQFRDPEITLRTRTENHYTFKKELDKIKVGGGDDCPETSIGAIKMALENSRPRSYVYVFTDATAKDYKKVNEVLRLVQEKLSKVIFLMTGDCGRAHLPEYDVYQQIAFTSSGQVYHVEKKEVRKVTNLLQSSILQTAPKVNLLTYDDTSKDKKKRSKVLSLPVDESMSEFTVSISGKRTTINFLNPRGIQIDPSQLSMILNLENVKVVKFKEPESGLWTLKVGSDSHYEVRSSGFSNSDFVYGFSSQPTINKADTSLRPVKGALTNLLIWPTQPKFINNFTSLDLVGTNGKVFNSLSLELINENLYNTKSFVTPDEFFYITVYGVSSDGHPFKRITPSAVTSVKPEKAEVDAESEVKAQALQPSSVSCKIKSLLPFGVQWFKNGLSIDEIQHYMQSADVIIDFSRVSMADDGVYECRVNNSVGVSYKKIKLNVKAAKPVIHKGSSKINSLIANHVELECRVTGDPKPTINWYFGNNQLPQNLIMNNGSLILQNVTLQDDGLYICTARNVAGYAKSTIYLGVIDPPKVILAPAEVTVTEGEIIELECQTTGAPLPTITWLKDNHTFNVPDTSDGGILRFTASGSDSGIYSCQASNLGGKDVKYSTVTVIVPPRITDDEEETVQVIKGSYMRLKCNANGFPSPTISWSKNGLLENHKLFENENYSIGENGLMIINATTQLSGRYICSAENSGGISRKTYNLEVVVPPEVVLTPANVTLVEGQIIELRCRTTGLPIPTVKWMKENHHLEIPDGTVDGKLRFTVNGSDSGIYSCHASNVGGTDVKHSIVTVIVPPRIIDDTEETVQIVKGSHVRLKCTASGFPIPVISWSKDGIDEFHKLADNENYSIGDKGLFIIDATVELTGRYICSGRNHAGVARKTYNVNVFDPPQVELKPTEVTLMEGEIIELECKTTGTPSPVTKWLKNNKPFELPDGSIDRVLRFTTKGSDTGIYSCLASNFGGSDIKNSTVTVVVPPRIDNDTEETVQVIKGSFVRLKCSIHGFPAPTISWSKTGTQKFHNISDNENYSIGENGLTIVNAIMELTGTYMCSANNSGGTVKKIYHVEVIDPPRVIITPTEVTLTEGQMIELKCQATGVPVPTIKWFKNNYPLKVPGEAFNQILRFTVNGTDSGIYSCQASNHGGTDIKNSTVVVIVPPKIVGDIEESIQVIKGNSVHLKCSADGFPTPTISWGRNRTQGYHKLSDGEDYSIGGNGLKIINSAIELTGIYICSAENSGGIAKKIFHVEVVDPPTVVLTPTEVTLLEGQILELECQATGVPVPAIKWMKDNHTITVPGGFVDRKLRFTVKGDDSGIYSCHATNSGGYVAKNASVTVTVPPRIIDDNEKVIEVIKGNDVWLNCNAIGFPTPIISWSKKETHEINKLSDGKNYSLGSNGLKIINASTKLAGTYYCSAENSGGISKITYHVEVLVAPEILDDFPSIVNISLGDDYMFPCKASGFPEPSVLWFKGDSKITEDHNLVLWHVDLETNGTYSCVAQNKAGIVSRSQTLNVGEPESTIPHQSNWTRVEIMESGSSTLVCPTSPETSVKWIKDGKPVTERGDTRNFANEDDGRILSINEARESNSGVFTCIAESSSGKVQFNFTLDVVTIPYFINEYVITDLQINEGESVSFDCAVGGNPTPKVNWIYSGQDEKIPVNPYSFPAGVLDETKQNLKIISAKSYHSGQYKCTAFHSIEILERTFKLTVNGPPTIEGSPEERVELILGQSYNLICSIKGIPVPIYSWIFNNSRDGKIKQMNGSLIDNSPRYYNILKLENVTTFDSGTYECTANNKFGLEKKSFDVRVLGPPEIKGSSITEIIKVKSKENLHLTCSINGLPMPVVEWTRNGIVTKTAVFNNNQTAKKNTKEFWWQNTVVLPPVSGNYSCRAYNEAGSAEKKFSVIVN